MKDFLTLHWKKLILGLLALVLLAGGAYYFSTPWLKEPSTLQIQEIEGVSIVVREYRDPMLEVTISSRVGELLLTSPNGILEKEENGVWYDLQHQKDREILASWKSLEHGEDWEWQVPIVYLGPRLRPGHYRWATEFRYLEEEPGVWCAVEFDID